MLQRGSQDDPKALTAIRRTGKRELRSSRRNSQQPTGLVKTPRKLHSGGTRLVLKDAYSGTRVWVFPKQLLGNCSPLPALEAQVEMGVNPMEDRTRHLVIKDTYSNLFFERIAQYRAPDS